jgi:alpha-mannosidase
MRISILFSLCLMSSVLVAQHRTAPNGYYPPDFTGDTFTGTVVTTDAANETVNLEYRIGQSTESLSVRLNGGCAVPSRTGELMHANNIPQGSVIRAFYTPRTEKHDGKKQKVYAAFGISIVEWHGKTLSESDRQKVYPCGTSEGYRSYRVW